MRRSDMPGFQRTIHRPRTHTVLIQSLQKAVKVWLERVAGLGQLLHAIHCLGQAALHLHTG